MQKKEYQAFKEWLINTNKIQVSSTKENFFIIDMVKTNKLDTPDYLGALCSANHLIDRFIDSGRDLFYLIKNDKYNAIYQYRMHYHHKNQLTHNALLAFSFEYLGKDLEPYIEYEISTYLKQHTNSKTLYIYQGNIVCIKYKHPIIDVVASIVTNTTSPIYIHASYCAKCNITFIRKEEYLRLKSEHPFLVANFQEISQDGYTFTKPGKLNGESPLMFCGYNVQANGLCEEHRHLLLKNIIYNGILSKTDIIQYLEHFINFNGSKDGMHLAIAKWENDLKFVRNLDIETHPIISVTDIKPYSHKTN